MTVLFLLFLFSCKTLGALVSIINTEPSCLTNVTVVENRLDMTTLKVDLIISLYQNDSIDVHYPIELPVQELTVFDLYPETSKYFMLRLDPRYPNKYNVQLTLCYNATIQWTRKEVSDATKQGSWSNSEENYNYQLVIALFWALTVTWSILFSIKGLFSYPKYLGSGVLTLVFKK